MSEIVVELTKLNPEDTYTYQNFSQFITEIHYKISDFNLPTDKLQTLRTDAAKLKILGFLKFVLPVKLVNLLLSLRKHISDGAQIFTSKTKCGKSQQIIMDAMYASLTALCILTSSDMHKSIYLEDVIDDVLAFVKHCIQHVVEGPIVTNKRMSSKCTTIEVKKTPNLHHYLREAVGLLAELIDIQLLTDKAVFNASTIGITSFLANTLNELHVPAVKLLTVIFMKYNSHRRFLFDAILASISKQPSKRKDIHFYRLSSEEKIHMFSALILHLIQSIPYLPELNAYNNNENFVNVMENKYKSTVAAAAGFMSDFMNECINKRGKSEYRSLFETFIQDLLKIVTRPEWPGSMLLLTVLARLSISKIQNKASDLPSRVSAMEHLGTVIAGVRKHVTLSQNQLYEIDRIIQETQDHYTGAHQNEEISTKHKIQDEEKVFHLQKVLLNYISVNNMHDEFVAHARSFYIAVWYYDILKYPGASLPLKNKSVSEKSEERKPLSVISQCKTTSKNNLIPEEKDKKEKKRIKSNNTANKENCGAKQRKASENVVPKQLKLLKQFLVAERQLGQRRNNAIKTMELQTNYLSIASVKLIVQFLILKGEFNRCFDGYIKQIFHVLTESSVIIRTKAMKSLRMIVEADPSVLNMTFVQTGVNCSFLDSSISVREAAVDLVGKFLLKQPELINKYYDMLSSRILDTGVSVRKRVIKILKEISVEFPEFTRNSDIWLKLLKRINDEEGIRKLITDIFSEMWFKPIPDSAHNNKIIIDKVRSIIELVSTSWNGRNEYFYQLLQSMFKPQEKMSSTRSIQKPCDELMLACRQIISCLVENVLKQEESGSLEHMSACLKTLYMFAKIQPQLLVCHLSTLQPYLNLQFQGDYQAILCTAELLKLTVPLIDHPSEIFLAQIEEDLVKLIIKGNETIVQSSISCLEVIVNQVTHNFKLIKDCFLKFYGHMKDFKNYHESNPANSALTKTSKSAFQRAIFIVGALLRHFSFTNKEVMGNLDENIIKQSFEVLMYFIQHSYADIQLYALKAIGAVCIRYYEFMFQPEVKTFYQHILTTNDIPLEMKKQVLKNIVNFLQEEEQEIIKREEGWENVSHQEKLGEANYLSSGMASTVIQIFNKQILGCCLHDDSSVRQIVIELIQLIIQQGLIQPNKVMPHLICLSTDVNQTIRQAATGLLQDMDRKHPSVMNPVIPPAISLTYELQRLLQNKGFVVRGLEENSPKALLSSMYSLIRKNKHNRRGLIRFIMKEFDQDNLNLSKMMFLSDNVAHFPYEVEDEPLFVIHLIDIVLSTVGCDLLKEFEENLLKPKDDEQNGVANTEEEEEESMEGLLSRVPEDTNALQKCTQTFQGCLLLIVLKHHLKQIYNLQDAKLLEYSPEKPNKGCNKQVTRRNNCIFNPTLILKQLEKEDRSKATREMSNESLVEQYLKFRRLIHELDMEEPDDENNHLQTKVTGQCNAQDLSIHLPTLSNNSIGVQDTIVSQHYATKRKIESSKKSRKKCKSSNSDPDCKRIR